MMDVQDSEVMMTLLRDIEQAKHYEGATRKKLATETLPEAVATIVKLNRTIRTLADAVHGSHVEAEYFEECPKPICRTAVLALEGDE